MSRPRCPLCGGYGIKKLEEHADEKAIIEQGSRHGLAYGLSAAGIKTFGLAKLTAGAKVITTAAAAAGVSASSVL